jgi:hypothetical protein
VSALGSSVEVMTRLLGFLCDNDEVCVNKSCVFLRTGYEFRSKDEAVAILRQLGCPEDTIGSAREPSGMEWSGVTSLGVSVYLPVMS